TVSAQLERPSNDVRAATCGHYFFVRRHKRRAHDAGLFETTAAAVALLEIADERSVLERKGQSRLERQLDRSHEIISQMIVDPVGESKNFSGVENVFWIERLLDFAHDVEKRIAELVAHIFRARD